MTSTRMISLEEEFKALPTQPIIANWFDTTTQEGREKFDNMLMTVYEGNTLKPAPQCSCVINPLRGRFRLGEVCPTCGDQVKEVFEQDVDSNIWLTALPGTGAFISPLAWHFMQRYMRSDGVDCLRYVTDPHYRPKSKKLPSRLRHVIDTFIPKYGRGLKAFHDHFDEFMECFIYRGVEGGNVTKGLKPLVDFIAYNRDKIFTMYLPVPNRVMFPVEKSGVATYGDSNMTNVLNAVRIIQEGESRKDTLTQKSLESRMVACIELFSTYHYNVMKKLIGSKYGMMRQHVFGGRWHFSSRAVVISIHDPHDFRTLHLPWSVAIEQYRMQLVNKLFKRGYAPQDAYNLLTENATRYSPIVDELFKELIEESPYIGLPLVLQRNPTIRRPSAILVYVSKVKTDTKDHTISVSTGNLTGMNCDFDGDQLNTFSVQDIVSHDKFVVLSPEHNVMDLSKPWAISDALKLQPPVVSTLASWLANGRQKAYGSSYGSDRRQTW